MDKWQSISYLQKLKKAIYWESDARCELSRWQNWLSRANAEFESEEIHPLSDSTLKKNISYRRNVFAGLFLGIPATILFLCFQKIIFNAKLFNNGFVNTLEEAFGTDIVVYSLIFGIYFIISVLFVILFIYKNKTDYKNNYYQKQTQTIEAIKKTNALITEARKNRQQILQNIEASKLEYDKASTELARLANQGILGKKYHDGLIIDRLIEYLNDGRADTIKESLNLYIHAQEEFENYQAEYAHRVEMKKRMDRQLQATNDLYDEAARARVAAEQAKESADDAAFWGAAATYVASKNRK